ncbi:MAG: cyclic nucleotide-binding domain-containing protein [Chitinivibrionales bacterium]
MPDIVDDSYSVLENVIFLKKSALFSAVQTGDLKAIAAVAQEVHYKSRETIVYEDEIGDSFYLIKHGGVLICKSTSGTDTVKLAELSEGECFGDMSLFDAEVRSASVIAKTDCVLLRIMSENMQDVLQEYPSIAIELLSIFVKRLRKANEIIQTLSLNQNQ